MTDTIRHSARQPGAAILADEGGIGVATTRAVWGRRAFSLLAWLFATCVATQVFFAGMGVFTGPSWWSTHTSFVHLFEYLPLLMLVAAFVGQLPARVKWLSLAALFLIGLQYAFVALRVPVLVVHGEKDPIVPVANARRIAAAQPDADVWLYPDGNHSCNNLHTIVRPAISDWLAERLGAA